MVDMGRHGTTFHMDVDISLALLEPWRKFDHRSVVVNLKWVVDPFPSRTSRDR